MALTPYRTCGPVGYHIEGSDLLDILKSPPATSLLNKLERNLNLCIISVRTTAMCYKTGSVVLCFSRTDHHGPILC